MVAVENKWDETSADRSVVQPREVVIAAEWINMRNI